VNVVGRPAPDWGHWGYGNDFLPSAFHKTTGPGSVSHVMSWIKGNPLVLFRDEPAGYYRVENTLLVLDLTLCELERVLFTKEDAFRDYPAYIRKSELTLKDWDNVRVGCQTLVNYIVDGPVPESNGVAPDSASGVQEKSKVPQ
jgi:hypothetical protein